MIKKIKTYKYEKVEVSSSEINLPDEPLYAFETGVRRSIRIIPKFVNWETHKNSPNKKGDLYELEVTCVYLNFECRISKFDIRVSEIENYVNGKGGTEKTDICHALFNDWFDIRTKQQFDSDLYSAIFSIAGEKEIKLRLRKEKIDSIVN